MNDETTHQIPIDRICLRESKDLFISFCTLICILYNKKLNLANIFLLLLKEKKVMDLYKSICEFETDFEGVKYFLEYDSSLHKSKYIKKYLNSQAKKRGTK
tara:strand:- start:1662 stop:1964 length:303 start_codon:yes stop_codon:yes gene_type:complete